MAYQSDSYGEADEERDAHRCRNEPEVLEGAAENLRAVVEHEMPDGHEHLLGRAGRGGGGACEAFGGAGFGCGSIGLRRRLGRRLRRDVGSRFERVDKGADLGLLRAQKLLRGIDADQTAGGEERDALAKQEGFAQIVGDEGDGLAEARGKRAELALQFGARDGIERAERLVHEQDGRIAGEGARDADALTLASRELARVASGEFAGVEADEEEHLADSLADALLGPALEARDQRNVALDRPVREKADVLDDVTDAAAQADGVPGGLIAAVNENLAGGGRQQEIYELKRSGFAGTAASEEDQGLSAGNG